MASRPCVRIAGFGVPRDHEGARVNYSTRFEPTKAAQVRLVVRRSVAFRRTNQSPATAGGIPAMVTPRPSRRTAAEKTASGWSSVMQRWCPRGQTGRWQGPQSTFCCRWIGGGDRCGSRRCGSGRRGSRPGRRRPRRSGGVRSRSSPCRADRRTHARVKPRLGGSSARLTTPGRSARETIARAAWRSPGPQTTRTEAPTSSVRRRARVANDSDGHAFAGPNAPPVFRQTTGPPVGRPRWDQAASADRSSSSVVNNSSRTESTGQPRRRTIAR